MNVSPQDIHELEKRWAMAEHVLDEMIKLIMTKTDIVKTLIGLSDASITFDMMRAFVERRREEKGMYGVMVNELLCAAALTKLIRQDDYDMSQFELDITKGEERK